MTRRNAGAGSGDNRGIARYLRRHGIHVVTAESCTAGLIASRIAEVPGCGDVLYCAIVAYSPSAKEQLLRVPSGTIRRYGLTSEEVSLAMALGAMQLTGVDLALANTGVADDGGDGDTPAGTQCFAWVFRRPGHAGRAGRALEDAPAGVAVFTETRRFPGERNAVREAAADWALARICHYHELARRGEGNRAAAPDELPDTPAGATA
ncbi:MULTISPECIES: CinA family protein [Cupriavidus]|uniref:Nicotinamide-nucleotide amidohydrolase family protein n=1 Tax=Cupriavidus oxalaticus TaxID=96344 RepID=A0A4P7L3J2_9BURK|nr:MULTISPECIES: nicotinamide-nucleotide amidohydrolase family protein [Cupriavidus]MBF6987895.1 nicotinamide-nucleotide amidohydrolase family protein [Cupriavidus sp. IK-TO18]QBY49996.1 nicotinamide-nucleotide amidohydrolase family protein [Cupriavidus oxalaticus]TDF65525.1 nicotinamide-nucleotide amidohydrolase family protein [Cupriavidus sp. L7L]